MKIFLIKTLLKLGFCVEYQKDKYIVCITKHCIGCVSGRMFTTASVKSLTYCSILSIKRNTHNITIGKHVKCSGFIS